MKDDNGFSLIEMLVVIGLVAILTAISFGGLRNYWLTQALEGGANEIVAQLSQLQAQVTSESHPLVFGARFPSAGSTTFGLVRYDPTGARSCTQVGTASTSGTFSPGGARVIFPGVLYPTNPTGYGFDLALPPSAFCNTGGNLKTPSGAVVTTPPVSSTDQYVWFYAKGTASAGRLQVTLPALTRTIAVTVKGLTGRVERS